MYMNKGWRSCESGLSNPVSDSQWEQLADGTARAKAILLEVASFKDKDPMWYEVMQMVAQSEGWDKAQAQELFDQAITYEPGFLPLLSRVCEFPASPMVWGARRTRSLRRRNRQTHPGARWLDFVLSCTQLP